jgi:hypothetical protein
MHDGFVTERGRFKKRQKGTGDNLIRFGDYDGLPYEVQSAPDHDPIEAHIRTLRALAANPLDARSHARSGPTAAHKIL